MLFVFPDTVSSPFWMKNTLIPLSIAFINARGVIVDIQDRQPLDETLHYPAASYRYALEVPQGSSVSLYRQTQARIAQA